MNYIHLKISLAPICVFFITQIGFSQSVISTILNTAGNSKQLAASSSRYPKYSFEWSVGESSIVTSNAASTILVNHGLLQGYLIFSPQVPAASNWLADEIKLYPNPVILDLTVDLLSIEKGIVTYSVFNSQGMLALQFSKSYQGVGQTENIRLRSLPSGSYFLQISIKQFADAGGLLIKQGAFPIIKVR